MDQRARVSNVQQTQNSVNPLLQVVACLECSSHLIAVHGGILGHVLGVLPLEELDAVLGVRSTAKVAVCSGLLVLWLAECQGHGNGARAAVELDLEDVGDVIRSQLAAPGAVGLDEERQRLGNTDGGRELDQAALGEAALHNGLGHLTADVCGRAIHLGGVLAGEGTATVGTPAAVGVNDDLAASEAGITLRTADDELAGWVDVVVSVVTVQGQGWLAVLEDDVGQGLLDNLLDDELVHVLHAWGSLILAGVALDLLAAGGLERLGMLGGDDHGVDLLGLHGAILLLLVLDGDLGLAIRTQPPQLTALAHVCEGLAKASGHGVGQRHAVLGLIAGIAEHDALITSTDIHVLLADVHTTCNVRRLLVDAHQDLAGLVAETLGVDGAEVIHVGVVTDALDCLTDTLLVVDLGLGGDL